jgi:hypothetical protein
MADRDEVGCSDQEVQSGCPDELCGVHIIPDALHAVASSSSQSQMSCECLRLATQTIKLESVVKVELALLEVVKKRPQ